MRRAVAPAPASASPTCAARVGATWGSRGEVRVRDADGCFVASVLFPYEEFRMTPLRVAIVDDEPPARLVLREFLEARPDVELVAECLNGFEAVKR